MKACAIMVVRDDAMLLEHNIRYHAHFGIDCFAIMDHCSVDNTPDIITKLSSEFPIVWIRKNTRAFDHEAYANEILSYALKRFDPDWVFPLDADEFLWCLNGLDGLMSLLDHRAVKYASLKWLNALPPTNSREIIDVLGTRFFYEPWPERPWQHEGHFRKAFSRNHSGIAIVVGGHYFRREANTTFFELCDGPHLIDIRNAGILHFELRDGGEKLYAKWKHLARDLVEPQYQPDAPWNEKIHTISEHVRQYERDKNAFVTFWSAEPRTVWGTRLASDKIQRMDILADWLLRNQIRSTPNLS